MDALYRVRRDCRLCQSSNIDLVVPLAPMPIATPNFRVSQIPRSDAIFREAVPLDLYLCRDCDLLQVTHVSNARLQFQNYVYTTSLSVGLADHFQRAADDVTALVRPSPRALVIEIGSNDGTLLNFYKAKGFRVQGCDPAVTIADQATKRGIPTIPDFFTTSVAQRIKEDGGSAAIVIANNIIANVDDLTELVTGVREVLADEGVFVFETQYGLDVIRDNLLDTIYHEHLSYFYLRPLQLYFRQMGMEIFDVFRIPTKGGSIRVFAQKIGGRRSRSPAVDSAIACEREVGAYGDKIYSEFAARIAAVRQRLHVEIDNARTEGRLIGGYGVSVGTSTLLAQFALGDKLDVLFDDDPTKDPILSGPGYDLPVRGPGNVITENPALIVIFAWRYANFILAKHGAWLDAGGTAAIPLPDVRLVRRF